MTRTRSVSLACLCAALLLGLCSARGPPTTQPTVPDTNCPQPCVCTQHQVTCQACPIDYLTVNEDTEALSVKRCKNIEYLLRLHSHRATGKNITTHALKSLEIKDSFIEKIPESCFASDYDIKTLILTNNSINKIDVGLRVNNLTVLNLSHNNLSAIENRTFVNMSGLNYLDLSANVIINVSVQCFEGLGKLLHLDLSANNLTLLDDAVFLPLASLQQLNLSDNQLVALSERSFSSLLMLQQLDVSYNRLTRVAPGALQFLPNLARLLLADNPQLRPDAQVFVGTGRRLQQVDASRTGLSQVPEALTHSVRFLSLAGNHIAAVRRGDLDSYPLLHLLDFGHNIIFDIEDDALGRLEMLSQLYLNRNNLTTVPKMLPDKLSHLSLDSNSIVNLTTSDFTPLTGLKILLLSNNLISYIQENVFVQLGSLEVLDLSNNPIQVLTPNTFNGPVALKDLRIAFVNITPPARDISFPVPSPEGIENLHLEFSPGLTRALMADTAALAAMTRLQLLDMRFSNITELRSDLLHFFPQLKILRLEGNKLNCSNLNWLGDWMRENSNEDNTKVKCFLPKSKMGKLVVELPQQKNISKSQPPVASTRKLGNITKDSPPRANKTFKSMRINKAMNVNETQSADLPIKIIQDKLSNFIENNDTINTNFAKLQKIKISRLGEKDKNFTFKEIVIKNNEKRNNKTKFLSLERQVLNDSEQNNEHKGKSRVINSNYDIRRIPKGDGNKSNELNEINTLLNNFPMNSSSKDKLFQIFSELSRQSNNFSKLADTHKNINQTAREYSLLCAEPGNLNGTENKTKCLQLPTGAPAPSADRESKNTKPERFIYRKNGNDKSAINAKSKKSNTAPPTNATSIPRQYENNNYRGIKINTPLISPEIQTADMLTSQQVSDVVRNNEKTHKKSRHISKQNTSIIFSAINNQDILFGNTTSSVTVKKMEGSQTNMEVEVSRGGLILLDSKILDNSSDHRSSHYKSESSESSGHIGLVIVFAGLGACACVALGGACLARSRARGARSQEAMEVPTISAVGELW